MIPPDETSSCQRADITRIRGVVFDVYGTLCRHGERRSPYRQLLSQRKSAGAHWLRQVMCNPLSLAQTAEALELELPPGELGRIEEDLREELATITLFPEVPQVLSALKAAGYKLGLVSNLALPYAEPARRLLGGFMDTEIWSCEVGFMKPDPDIYDIASERLAIPQEELLFIGDSPACDVQGPRSVGMEARLLDRDRKYPDLESLSDLTEVLVMLALGETSA